MELLEKLREQMRIYDIDAYIIPTSDFHGTEYVSDYFKSRELLSGFTGSAGTLVVTMDNAYLWTDGRYFIQAEKQIQGHGVELMKMGQPGYPTINEFLHEHLSERDSLGFDGRLLSTEFVQSLKKDLPSSIQIKCSVDLMDLIWENRPALPYSLIYKLDEYYTGMSYKEKLAMVCDKMNEYKCDLHIISSLEDQAWLYNLRANDILHTPVFLAFTIIEDGKATLYVDEAKINLSIRRYLDDNEIETKPYNQIYDDIKDIKNKNILMSLAKVNYLIYNSLKDNNFITNKEDPTLILKAIKNEVEIKNDKLVHIRDGACVAKFMKYVKENHNELTEISASDYLANLRHETKGYVDLSFDTIAAFKEHGAMMHYSATAETDAKLNDNGLLLVDSGGHYLGGTTDITRTFALGEVSDEMKLHFTTVLKSVIRLARATFLRGCNGQNLDILARGPIWDLLIDYKCGTGHGVGHLLSVHESPNGFRWQKVPERNDSAKFQEGMKTTDEPGIYLEGKYGIRIENEMICVNKGKTEFGEFLGFETITCCPIDLDAINPDLLTFEEKDWLNSYHQMVYEKLSEYFQGEDNNWLRHYTRAI